MADKMMSYKGAYIVSDEMLPVRNHQIYEELLQFQKEFAGMIYYQKDRDGRIP